MQLFYFFKSRCLIDCNFFPCSGKRPVVQNIFHHRFHIVEKFCFPLVGVVIPPESSFEETPVYEYEDSVKVELTLQESGRFMEIDTDKATFIVTKSKFPVAKGRTHIYNLNSNVNSNSNSYSYSNYDYNYKYNYNNSHN